MGEIWIPEAEDLEARGNSGTMRRNHNNPKVTWHVTVSPPGSFNAVSRWLANNKSEPHIVYDPDGDRLGQFFPLDRGARALRNDGSTPTNRDGTINIQIEVCAMPGNKRLGEPGFTDLPEFDPTAPNFRALMRAIRSWDIPDEWPTGALAEGNWASEAVPRLWPGYRLPGHHGHCRVPGNKHWDPGWIDQLRIFQTGDGKRERTEKYTREDVARFQRVHGIEPDDGLWGPSTDAQVQAIRRCLKPGEDRSWSDLQRYWDLRLSRPKGEQSSYEMRRAVQWALGTVKVDGVWGDETEAAWQAIRDQHHMAYEDEEVKTAPRKNPPADGDDPLKFGSRGDDVRGLQKGLNDVFPSYSDLAVDGIYGRGTEDVVEEFQSRVGLTADGVIGKETRAALAEHGVTF